MVLRLKPFQREFERAVENPAFNTVALSGPRGLGKTFLAGRILSRCLTPGDRLHEPGKEYILGAASIEQARMAFAFVRATLEPLGGYRFIDSATRLGITHAPTNTKLRVISSNAKTSFGLVNVPIVVLDEPGGLEIVGGQMLADALFSAQGKVGSPLKLVLIGTLGPMATGPGHWWWDLVHAGTKGRTHVQLFQGDRKNWDNWNTIRRANPLLNLDANARATLHEERDAARSDGRLKARFVTYRLNIPEGDESEVLLTVDDFETMRERPQVERDGAAIVGVDLGAGRAWSSAVAIWPGGRIECFALAAGIPDLGEMEKRDRVPSGLYRKLRDDGLLLVDDGLRVQRPEVVWDEILNRWGFPAVMVSDRFREKDLMDASDGQAPLETRVWRWSDAAEDIRALRKGALDGPFNIGGGADLLAASLSVSMVKNDDAGNVRLVKGNTNNTARDDVSAALILAAGEYQRWIFSPPAPAEYYGMI